jgi:hypothetical protein
MDRQPGPYREDVVGDVRVSTIVRESSALTATPVCYFETMAFPVAGDPQILWFSTAGHERLADRQHDLAVRWFSRAS